MTDNLCVSLSAKEMEICRNLKEELNARSMQYVLRLALITFGKDHSKYEYLKRDSTSVLLDYEHQQKQEDTKLELRKITLFNRQCTMIKNLRRQGIRESDMEKLYEKLNEQLEVFDIELRHQKKKAYRVGNK